MFKHISLAMLFILSTCVQANECSYDFDQDKRCDSYTMTPLGEAEGLNLLTISLSSGKKISGIFNTGSAGIAAGYFSGEIIVPLGFYSPRTVEQSTYTFRWNDSLKNLVGIEQDLYTLERMQAVETATVKILKSQFPEMVDPFLEALEKELSRSRV